jgi:hypothetical protein
MFQKCIISHCVMKHFLASTFLKGKKTYIPISLVEFAICTHTFLEMTSVPMISNILSSHAYQFLHADMDLP